MLEPGKLTEEESLKVLYHHYHSTIYGEGLELALSAIVDPNSHVAPAWIREYEYSLTPEGQQRFRVEESKETP